MKSPVKKFWKWALIGLGTVLVVGMVGFVVWAVQTPPVGQLATSALASTDTVKVEQRDGVTFRPAHPNGIGLVLYQGAKVPPASYAYVAHKIAEQGYTVFIPQLPLNLAVFDSNAADGIIKANPELTCWVVGGHSLGGAMAAEYAKDHAVAGLVLWAAYPASSNDLSTSTMKVLSISGSRDGLSTAEKIAASKKNLPSSTEYVAIAGGNHAQFGDYGPQSGDNAATISLRDQQAQIADATLKFLGQPSLCVSNARSV